MNGPSSTQPKPETTLQVAELPPQPGLTRPGPFHRWWFQLGYAFQRQRWSLLFILAGVATLVGLAICLPAWRFAPGGINSAPPNVTEWLSRMQNLVGFLTLLVAVVVWLGEVREAWEESLPKRMSVFFFLDDTSADPARPRQLRPVIVSRNVWLAGEDDLRQWGMQVASQAVTAYVKVPNPSQLRLDFGPDVNASEGRVLADAQGKPHRHYAIRFKLTRLPEPLEQVWRNEPEPLCLYQNLAAGHAGLQLVRVAMLTHALGNEPDWPDAVRSDT